MGYEGEVRPYRRKGQKRQLETVFGEVIVERLGYINKKRASKRLYPEDGKLNLPADKYSHGLRPRVVQEAAKVSFQETSNTISETTGGKVGKRQWEELIVKGAIDFEKFYSQKEAMKTGSAEGVTTKLK